MRRVTSVLCTLAVGVALGVFGTATLNAQQGIKRTPLQKVTVDGVTGKDAVMGIAEVAPGAAAGRHTHPGNEIGYVMEGTTILEIDGEAPIELRAGDSYSIPAGRIHDARNTGTVPARVLAVYIVDTGKPLATPAPAR